MHQGDEAVARARAKRLPALAETRAGAAARRVTSVDALRGFIMIWIIGGDGFAHAIAEMSDGKGAAVSAIGNAIGDQFDHVDWQGYTFYDLIFPMFIFITGVSIVFSLTRLAEQEGKPAAHLRILQRSVVLYVLGLIEYGGVSESLSDVRLVGVLQRIAICYLFASLLFLNLRVRGLVIACVAIIVGYWAVMTFVPVPGVGTGVFEWDGNLAWWIDAHYLPGRKWDGTSDPEGLLSTIPAIATCLLGVLAGLLIRQSRVSPQHKSFWLMGTGAAMIAAGHIWDMQFPIIKYIWTSSFVLVTGGYSLLLLGLLHQITDIWGYKAWTTVFTWVGSSAIVLYMLNMIVGFQPLATRLVGGDIGVWFDDMVTPGTGSLVSHAVGLAFAISLAGFLYRRRIFLRV